MIEIFINGKQLVISKNTSVCLEVENSVFDIDSISAEIIWQFDIAAKANSSILELADCIIFGNTKRYDCNVMFSGVPIGNGSLYIQSINNEKNIQCGLTINEFSAEWKTCKMNKNNLECFNITDYDYKSDWKIFLTKTLDEDSNVKFFPFIDEQFSESEDFGYFRNQRSSLSNNRNDFIGYINRIFLDDNGNIIECYDNAPQGLRIFNSDSGTGHKINGYHFAPAFRLVWIIEKILQAQGFSLCGSFCENKFIKNLFLQSMNAMDADSSQYDNTTYMTFSGITGMENTTPITNCMRFLVNNQPFETFSINNSGIFSVSFRLFLQDMFNLKKNVTGWQYLDLYDETYFIVICDSSVDLSKSFCRIKTTGSKDYIGEFIKFGKQEGEGAYFIYYYYTAKKNNIAFIQLTDSSYRQALCNTDGDFAVSDGSLILDNMFDLDRGNSYQVLLVKANLCTVGTKFTIVSDSSLVNGSIIDKRGVIEHIKDIQVIASNGIDNISGLNVFSKDLDLKKYLPDVSNSEFIKSMCKLFGLNLYINSDTKTVQMNFFADEMTAKALDVSNFVFNKKKKNYDTTSYEITFESTLETKDIDESNIIDSVITKELLPLPRMNFGKHCFVKNENKFYVSAKDDNNIVRWISSSGNNNKLCIGDNSNVEEVNIDVKIPNMRFVDADHTEKYFQEIDIKGCSSLLQTDYSGKFDIILTQYVGKKMIRLEKEGNHQYVTIERANPTCYNENGSLNSNYINMAPTGVQSIGEMWLKPKYQFLATAELFEFDLLVPINIFWEIKNLLKPQEGITNEQTRWIMIDNQRFLPKKISAQMGDSDLIKVNIECARELNTL